MSRAEFAQLLSGSGQPNKSWIKNIRRYEQDDGEERRGLNWEVIRFVDSALHAGGAFEGLAWAIGTPSGLEPSTNWAHNYQPREGPVWIWIRPSSTSSHTAAEISCGPISLSVRMSSDDDGVVVTLPYAMPNPPFFVDLSRPGWVDFGQGEVPANLGLPTMNAMGPKKIDGKGVISTFQLLQAKLQPNLRENRAWISFLLATLRADAVPIRGPVQSIPIDLTRFEDQDHDQFSRDREAHCGGVGLRRLRLSRRLALRPAAIRASNLDPSSPIHHTTLARIERGEAVRDWGSISQRLDIVYGADGRISQGIVKPMVDRGSTQFYFPAYWVGPVWVSLQAPRDESHGLVRLQWGGWKNRVHVRGNTVLTFRRAKPGEAEHQLVVIAPKGWVVRSGLGRIPDAVDINSGWLPVSKDFQLAIKAKVENYLRSIVG